LVAEAYRALAAYPRKRLNASTIQTARDEYAKELRGLLSEALNDYVLVQESLANRREDQPLTAVEYSLLRNCYFAQAATLYELDRFQEAIGVYTTMVNRYQSEPQVLDAYFQLATCQRKVGQLEEAQATLDQARLALERLQRESQNFVTTTNHDAGEWQRILEWMSKL
jgi:tetratricopeptide (TPR) repeat protein